MGEILERVQNKFACIIGELCSEPVVLSKFAIWLDLRLAEYKAKGAISLDGFGENPNPTWLKGHDTDKAESQSSDVHENVSFSQQKFPFQGGDRTPGNIVNSENQLCGDSQISDKCMEVVYIKEENPDNLQSECIYPSQATKRLSSDQTCVLKSNDTSVIPSKIRRFSASSMVSSYNGESEMTNQSLISIIGDSSDNGDSSMTNNDSSQLQDQNTSSRFTQFRGSNSFAGQLRSSAESPLQLSRFQSSMSPVSSDLIAEPDESHLPVPTCTLCGKTFTTKRSLIRHDRVHQRNAATYTCPICAVPYSRKEHLRNHMNRSHHKEATALGFGQ